MDVDPILTVIADQQFELVGDPFDKDEIALTLAAAEAARVETVSTVVWHQNNGVGLFVSQESALQSDGQTCAEWLFHPSLADGMCEEGHEGTFSLAPWADRIHPILTEALVEIESRGGFALRPMFMMKYESSLDQAVMMFPAADHSILSYTIDGTLH